MSALFISYRRRAHSGYALNLYQTLGRCFDPAQVFYDRDYREHIRFGDPWEEKLRQAIASAKVFLVLIAPGWLDAEDNDGNLRLWKGGDPVRWEIEQALKRHANGELQIIAVTTEGVAMPGADLLPPTLKALASIQACPLSDVPADYERYFEALLEVIAAAPGVPRPRPCTAKNRPFHTLELTLSKNFVDPAGHLPELRRALHEQGTAALIAAATVHGMGGVGKTQMALAYSHAERAEYAGVWWFRAENTRQLELDCKAFCERQGVVLYDGELPHQAVKRWLHGQPRWLLVYDNAENKHDIASFLPSHGGHHLIITSRDRNWDEIAQPLALDVWSEDQALDFLRRRLPDADDSERRQLGHALGGLPLALEQACAYILKHHISVAAYCAAIADWQRAHPLLDRQDAAGYPYSVLTTLSLSFHRLSDAARQLLHLCAWFIFPDAIPERIFRENTEFLLEPLKYFAPDDLRWAETVAQLESYSLIQRRAIRAIDFTLGESRWEYVLGIHRLTQKVVYSKLANISNDLYALTQLVQGAVRKIQENSKLLPHALAWASLDLNPALSLSHPESPNVDFDPLIESVKQAMHLVMLEDTYSRFDPDLLADIEHYGSEQPTTLNSMNAFVANDLSNGELECARVLLEKTLDISRRVFGGKSAVTLKSLANLARLNALKSNTAVANEILDAVVTTIQRELDDGQQDTLEIMEYVGHAYVALGNFDYAYSIVQKSLNSSLAVLGKEHGLTTSFRSLIFVILVNQRKFLEAKAHCEELIKICRSIQGQSSPAGLSLMDTLAGMLIGVDMLEIAQGLLKGELHFRCRILDEYHPGITYSAFLLYVTLKKMEEIGAALTIYKEHLAWLLERDLDSLSEDQQNIREQLIQFLSERAESAP